MPDFGPHEPHKLDRTLQVSRSHQRNGSIPCEIYYALTPAAARAEAKLPKVTKILSGW